MECYKKRYLALALLLPAIGVSAADTKLSFGDAFSLSQDQASYDNDAFKTKLVRLGNGALISVFGDGVDSTKIVYDLKGDVERAARDIYIRTCSTLNSTCDVEGDWSTPENVSGTATLSNIETDWQGDNGDPSAYWGDSDKPNISNGGSNIMITWTDKYCLALADDEDGLSNQRTVSYLIRDNREIPFSCTWARSATVDASGNISWSSAAQQLSDGERDAKQDVSKVNSLGQAVITWQEDPLGLQIGSAEGPGEGASGANASHGTDVWITSTTNTITKVDADNNSTAGKVTGFNTIARLTDNATNKAAGNYDVIKDASGNIIEGDFIDGGNAAATRANTGLVGSNVVVAYEETKGSEGLAIGKLVRYHSFPYADIPTAITDNIGCIISDPLENARRVRFMAQSSNLVTGLTGEEDSGLRLGIIWKQGLYDQGGPSDIMARVAYNGLATTDMVPAIDGACRTSDYLVAETVANTPAYNLSSNTDLGGNLADISETNNAENALAHRGAIVGNDLYIGYSYTPDWALANYTDQENYDFWLRHYDGTEGTWTDPKNVSNLPTKEISVREPRIVKTPYTTADTFGTYNPDAFVIAWGLQTNVASHIEESEDLDIIYTRTFDKGETFESNVTISNENANSRFESQIRPTPDNQTLYAVWNETDGTLTNGVAAVGITVDADDEEESTDSVYDTILASFRVGSYSSSSSGGAVGIWWLFAIAIFAVVVRTTKEH